MQKTLSISNNRIGNECSLLLGNDRSSNLVICSSRNDLLGFQLGLYLVGGFPLGR